MTGLQKLRGLTSSRVLNTLLSEPNLMQVVQSLNPGELSSLVARVGLHDAGELVALASTEQLVQLFDDDVWQAGDDAEERFDPERFALWLEVLFEAGEGTVVRRLLELPPEFVCLAVSRCVLVINMDALTYGSTHDDMDYEAALDKALENPASEEWEAFRWIDRGVGGFDVVTSALLALDTAHADALRNLLERCCQLSEQVITDNGGLIETLGAIDVLEDDARFAREQRRAVQGYVSLADARAFLRLAAQGLEYDAGRDPITSAHFRSQPVSAEQRPKSKTGNPSSNLHAKVKRSTPSRAPIAQSAMSEEALLMQALSELRDLDRPTYEYRSAELAYLANVLITASSALTRRLRPVEATQVALSMCCVGLRTLNIATQTQAEMLEALSERTLDGVFRKGWSSAKSLNVSMSEPEMAEVVCQLLEL